MSRKKSLTNNTGELAILGHCGLFRLYKVIGSYVCLSSGIKLLDFTLNPKNSTTSEIHAT